MKSQAAGGTIDAVTGVVTFSVAGVTAALSPEDARSWAEVLTAYAPLLLVGLLIWRLRILDKALTVCQFQHEKADERYKVLQDKVLVAYAASNPASSNMPSLGAFESGDFDVGKALKDEPRKP